jgi:hypothetical protein
MGGVSRKGNLRAVALLWVLLLALAACGDLSLYSTLEGDAGGDFHLSPNTALVPENTAFTFSALGGFLPYDIDVAGLTAKGEHAWEFPPTTIPGPQLTLDFTIEATDLLGNSATATITVFKTVAQPVLSETFVTLNEGDSWTFTVAGGLAPFAWSLDGVVDPAFVADNYPHLYDVAGSHTVELTDSLGFYCEATVTVVPAGPGVPLTISPTAATVVVSGTLSFEAFGGSGNYTFTPAGSFADPSDNPCTYTAPGTTGNYTVTVEDESVPVPQTATATVVVTATIPDPLTLTPSSPIVTAVGDTVLFDAAGGVPPYVFSTKKPADGNFLDPANPRLYTHLKAKKDVEVRLIDSTGKKVTTKVRWR